MPDGYSEYWERYKAGPTPTKPRLGAEPDSRSIYERLRSRWPEEIWEMKAGEAETARELYGLRAEISNWEALREMLNRPVDKIAHWLAGLEMDRVREQLRRVKEQADISRYKRELAEGEYEFGEWGAPAGERVTGGPGVRLARAREKARGGAGLTQELETTYPVPEWLEAWIEHSMPMGEAGEERGAFALRPLGAQTEASLEQLGEAKGYHTWGRAGAPLSLKEYARAEEESMESWWEEHRRLSESLFPAKVGAKRARWYPSRQTR